jgi:hypothetical protein
MKITRSAALSNANLAARLAVLIACFSSLACDSGPGLPLVTPPRDVVNPPTATATPAPPTSGPPITAPELYLRTVDGATAINVNDLAVALQVRVGHPPGDVALDSLARNIGLLIWPGLEPVPFRLFPRVPGGSRPGSTVAPGWVVVPDSPLAPGWHAITVSGFGSTYTLPGSPMYLKLDSDRIAVRFRVDSQPYVWAISVCETPEPRTIQVIFSEWMTASVVRQMRGRVRGLGSTVDCVGELPTGRRAPGVEDVVFNCEGRGAIEGASFELHSGFQSLTGAALRDGRNAGVPFDFDLPRDEGFQVDRDCRWHQPWRLEADLPLTDGR